MAKLVGAQQRIIMSYTVPPGIDEVESMVRSVLESLPDELEEYAEGLAISVEDFPDDSTSEELDLEDAYDLLALYKSGKQIAPGVEKKTANDDDVLIVYRRPLLDLWCESCEDIMALLRQVVIEEMGRHFDFAERDIAEMCVRPF